MITIGLLKHQAPNNFFNLASASAINVRNKKKLEASNAPEAAVCYGKAKLRRGQGRLQKAKASNLQ